MGVLSGRVALVTGAARGQGAAIASRFVTEGAAVLLTDVLHDQGAALAADLGAAYAPLDVTSEAEWAAAAAAAVERFGRLDALVNNAGIVHLAAVEETAAADFDRVLAVNVRGVFLGTKTVIPHLRAAGGGTIVNTSSIGGIIGIAGLAAYTASKFAVRGLTRTAALELAGDGIRVNAILPGRIDTPMSNPGGDTTVTAGIPLGRIGTTADIAELVVFLTSDASSFITGSEIVIDGGATAGPSLLT